MTVRKVAGIMFEQRANDSLSRPALVRVPDVGSEHWSCWCCQMRGYARFLMGIWFRLGSLASSTEYYKSGVFDGNTAENAGGLLIDIMNIILPTLGPDRRATYSTVSANLQGTGVVLQVLWKARKCRTGYEVLLRSDTNELVETPVPGRGNKPVGSIGECWAALSEL